MNHLKQLTLWAFCAALASCASAPKTDPRVTALEQSYNELVNNPELASRGGEELKQAENALNRVKNRGRDTRDREFAYSLYAADRLVQVARFSARARLAEDKRGELVNEQERLVLQARTLEAERAKRQAEEARLSAAEALALREKALADAAQAQQMREQAEQARSAAEAERLRAEEQRLMAESAADVALTEAEKAREMAEIEARKAEQARAEAEAAKAQMDAMQNRLSELEAKQTERGLLITLGDVLFEFNKSDLKTGVARNLMPLIDVLKDHPDQAVVIEGHTDSVGARQYNLNLSERRADAVRGYLLDHGVDGARITTRGLGPDYPVADNDSETGRQQNRRVEIILPGMKSN